MNGLRVTITITTAIQNYRIWSFRGISSNSVKFRGNMEIPLNGQIPRLGLKFRGPRKTVVPIDSQYSVVHIIQKWFMLRYVEHIILYYGTVKKLAVACRCVKIVAFSLWYEIK